jgi:lipooligosaccharide transport system permease protein
MATNTSLHVAYPSLQRASKLVQRNLIVYRHTWMIIFSGFFEPLFYLVAVGFGVGAVIESLPFKGVDISYAAFLAPGMLAASCMNGAITDGFFNPFFKLHFQKTYDGIVATPMNVPDIALGEMLWAQIRGSLYSVGFLIVMFVMGLAMSPLAVLALPAAMVTAGAFSAGAMVLTSTVKEVTSFEKVMNLLVFPLFLFSGTFFPVSLYPDFIRPLVYLSPLYHATNLLRSLTTGLVTPEAVLNLAYLVAMFLLCTWVAMRRLQRQLIL